MCTCRGWKQDGGRIELSRDALYNLWRIILDSCPDPSSGKMFCMKKRKGRYYQLTPSYQRLMSLSSWLPFKVYVSCTFCIIFIISLK